MKLIFLFFLGIVNDKISIPSSLDEHLKTQIKFLFFAGMALAIILNLVLCLINQFQHFVNIYWTTFGTWLLMLVQGCVFFIICGIHVGDDDITLTPADFLFVDHGDILVWYNMYNTFVMCCMLPIPVKWCVLCCKTTSVIHMILMIIISNISYYDKLTGEKLYKTAPTGGWNIVSIGFLHLGK